MRRWTAAGGLTLGFMLLGGWAEHNLAALLAWVLWSGLRLLQGDLAAGPGLGGRLRPALALAEMSALGIGLAMAFWLPSLLALRQAGGLPHDIKKFLKPGAWELSNLLLPMFNWAGKETVYFGVPALLLALASLAVARRLRVWRPAAAVCLVSLALLAGDSTPLWRAVAGIVPLFGALHYSFMFGYAFIFFAAVLAGTALEGGFEPRRREILILVVCLVAVALALALVARSPLDSSFVQGALGRRIGAAVAAGLLVVTGAILSSPWRASRKAWGLVFVVALDLVGYHARQWALPGAKSFRIDDLYRPSLIKDFLRAEREPGRLLPLETTIPEADLLFKRNEALIQGIETIPVAGHLPRPSYLRLLARMRGLNADWRDFSDRRWPMRGHEDLVGDPVNARILDLLNVRFVVTDGAQLAEEEVLREDTWRLYRRESAIPRASLVFDWQRVRDESGCYESALDARFDPKRSVLLAGDEPAEPVPAGGRGEGSVAIESRRPGVLRIRTKASERGVLLLSELWDPGWRAFVDGTPARTRVVDCLLTGVFVGPGEHRVEMKFQPAGLVPGMLISIGCLAWMVVLVAIRGGNLPPGAAGGRTAPEAVSQ